MKNIFIFFALVVLIFTATECFAFKTSGFSNPFGVTVDSKTNFIYVTNVNGAPNKRDDNGFVSRLKGDGTVDKLRFIDAASNKVTLNAPKGVAVLEDKLYVADIDKLHAFDLNSSKFLFDVNFGNLPVQHFYDVIVGPDGSLYVADGPGNTIYKIDVARQHEVTTFVSGDMLGQPHGIAWFPGRQIFAVAGWSSGKVIAFDRAGKQQTYPAILLRTLEGIASDDAGNMFVSSTGLSAIYRIAANFALHTFKLAIKMPTGLAYQKSGNQIITACFETGEVESLSISKEEEAVKKAVSDYVQPAPRPKIIEEKPVEEAAPEAEGEDKAKEEKPEKEVKPEKKEAEKKESENKEAEKEKDEKTK